LSVVTVKRKAGAAFSSLFSLTNRTRPTISAVNALPPLALNRPAGNSWQVKIPRSRSSSFFSQSAS
jgi:hypothetical protein